MLGVLPWEWTWRQLEEAAIWRLRHQWNQTADLLSMLFNTHVSKDETTRASFHPYPLEKKAKPAGVAPVAKKGGAQPLKVFLEPGAVGV